MAEKTLKETFSEKLKELRTRKGISQAALAKYLGIEQATVSNYENGINFPDPGILSKIAEYFKVGAADFLVNEPVPVYETKATYINQEIRILKEQITHLTELIERGEETQNTMIKLRKSLMAEIRLKDDMLMNLTTNR